MKNLILIISLFLGINLYSQVTPSNSIIPVSLTTEWQKAGANANTITVSSGSTISTTTTQFIELPFYAEVIPNLIKSVDGFSFDFIDVNVLENFMATIVIPNKSYIAVIHFPAREFHIAKGCTIDLRNRVILRGAKDGNSRTKFSVIPAVKHHLIGGILAAIPMFFCENPYGLVNSASDVFVISGKRNAGIECIWIDTKNAFPSTYHEDCEYNDWFNNSAIIRVTGGSLNCWVKGVQIDRIYGTGVWIDAGSRNNTVQGCYFNDSWTKGGTSGGQQGYGVLLTGAGVSHNLVENNIMRNLRHGVVIQEDCSDNVIAYNYVRESKAKSWGSLCWDGPTYDITCHGNGATRNLMEGNYVEGRLIADGVKEVPNGPSNTFYRNLASGKIEIRRETIDPISLMPCAACLSCSYNSGQIIVANNANKYIVKSSPNTAFDNLEPNNVSPVQLDNGGVTCGGTANPLSTLSMLGTSAYLTSIPSWMGGNDGVTFPPIGPFSSFENTNPARNRYINSPDNTDLTSCGNEDDYDIPLTVIVSHTYCNITAEGEVTSPGIVELQIVGGQAPYSCSWSDPVGISPVFSSDGCSFSLTESSFGSITYIVTDANGTTVTELVWAGCFYIDIGLGLNSDTNNQIEIQKKINSLSEEELKATINPYISINEEKLKTTTNSYKVYPNPFKEFTTLQIDLKETSTISVELFDILGRKLKTIETSTKFEAGNHQIEIINELRSGGIILLKINIGDKQFIEKLIIE